MKKSLSKSLQFSIVIIFFVGLYIYFSKTIIGNNWNIASSYAFPLQHYWLLGIFLLTTIIFMFTKYFHLIKSWLTRRVFSLAEITVSLWLLSCFFAFLTLGFFSVDLRVLYLNGSVIIGKITLVYTVYGVFTLLNMAVGYALLSFLKINCNKGGQKNIISIGLGITFLMLFFFAASLLHQISFYALGAYILLALILGRPYLNPILNIFFKRRISFGQLSFLKKFIGLIILFSFLIIIVSVAAPHPLGGDDLRAYYNLPKTFIEQGGITDFPYYVFNNAPHAATYLYIPILLISSFVLNYVNVFLVIALAAALFIFGSRLANRGAGLWSSLLFISMPLIYYFLITVKVDFLSVFFIVLGLLTIYIAHEEDANSWLGLGGLFIGMAIAVKYTSLFIVPGLIVAILLWPDARSLRKRLMRLIIVFGFIALAFGPWAIRNQIVFNNILHPFSSGGPTSNSYHYISLESQEQQRLNSYLSYIHNSFTHGLSYDQPWLLNVKSILTGRSNYPANAIGPFMLALLPLFALGFFTRKLIPLAITASVSILVWYWMSLFQIWYMMFVFAILAIIYGVTLTNFKRYWQRLILFVIILFLGWTINTSSIEFVHFLLPSYDKAKATSLHQSVNLLDYLNNTLLVEEPEYLIYDISGGGARPAYLIDSHKHKFIETNSFGKADIFVIMRDSEVLIKQFNEEGITHIHYSPSADDFWRDFYCPYNDSGACFQSRVRENFQALKPYLELVFEASDSDSQVYKINYED